MQFIGKVTLTAAITAALVSAIVSVLLVNTVEVLVPPKYQVTPAAVSEVTAGSWLVFDLERGEVIYSYQDQEVRPVASITKLPAAKIFADKNDVWATTSITWSDLNHYGRAGKLSYGEVYNYHTLFFPLLLESSNDTAAVLEREHSNLVADMNQYAQSLGLSNTVFTDASGLSLTNVSTAREIKSLLQDIFAANRHLVDISSLQSYLVPTKGWINNSPFALEDGYLGGKHGYLPEANKTAAVIFKEQLASGNSRIIGYVLLGSENLKQDIDLLRNEVQKHVKFE